MLLEPLATIKTLQGKRYLLSQDSTHPRLPCHISLHFCIGLNCQIVRFRFSWGRPLCCFDWPSVFSSAWLFFVVVVVVDFLLVIFLRPWNLEQGTISDSSNIELGDHLEAVTIVALPASFVSRGLHPGYVWGAALILPFHVRRRIRGGVLWFPFFLFLTSSLLPVGGLTMFTFIWIISFRLFKCRACELNPPDRTLHLDFWIYALIFLEIPKRKLSTALWFLWLLWFLRNDGHETAI